MSIPNVSLNDSVKVQNNLTVVKQNIAVADNANSNNLQRYPKKIILTVKN